MLTKRGADILSQIEQMMDDANRALGPAAADRRRRTGTGRPPRRATRWPRHWRDARSSGTDWPRARRRRNLPDPNSTSLTATGSIVRLLLGTLFALVVAAVVGLGATYLALTRGAAFGALRIGSWTAWPKTGTQDADPYARASIARSGRLPIALGDGLTFIAKTDDNGRPLDGRCDVVVVGRDAGRALLDLDAL